MIITQILKVPYMTVFFYYVVAFSFPYNKAWFAPSKPSLHATKEDAHWELHFQRLAPFTGGCIFPEERTAVRSRRGGSPVQWTQPSSSRPSILRIFWTLRASCWMCCCWCSSPSSALCSCPTLSTCSDPGSTDAPPWERTRDSRERAELRG